MNVLHITNSYKPNAGGVATAVHGLAQALRAAGRGVLVLTPQFSAQDGSDRVVRRLPLAAWDAVIANDFRIDPQTELHGRIQDFAADLIHVHGPFHLGPVAARLADDLNRPLVYTHHTKLEEYLHYCACARLDAAAVQAFYVDFANRCDLVLTPSGMEADNLGQLGVTKPIHVVPTGLDAAWFAAADAPNLPRERRVIGIVGRVSAEKQAAALARAAMAYLQRDARADLVVIGDGEQRALIHEDAAKRGLSDRVACRGFLPAREVRAALDRIDVVLNAPDLDTQCIVLLEAQARGVPIIASDVPVAREFVAEFAPGTAFYPPGDWEALTACLARFFALSAARRTAAQDAARTFARRFQETAIIQDLCRLYVDLAVRYEQNGATTPRHWDPALCGWVYQALTDDLVPLIQTLRAQ